MRTAYQNTKLKFSLLVVCSLICFTHTTLFAQSNTQFPAPTGHINDFAGVVDSQTKTRLESLLLNLKDKTKIDFYVATVDSTSGREMFDFSRQLSSAWDIGTKNNPNKSLLLVVSVASKDSFTQFSRKTQPDLPEGILGDMSQRMRSPLTEGRFSEAVDEGVQFFVTAIAQKLGLTAQLLEGSGSPSVVKVGDSTTETSQQTANASIEQPRTRPRVVKETIKPAEVVSSNATPATETKQPASDLPAPVTSTDVKPNDEVKAAEKEKPNTLVRSATNLTKPGPVSKTQAPPVDDEAEAEEVELTLTLPLAKRADKLKSFLDTHPDSKARPRATELLISTHAGLGDQYLKSGDTENGIAQLFKAIDESDVSISDKLFSGVISQIPSNLFLRGQSEAAFKAAANIESKFGSDPNRLLTVAGFYLGLERGDEAARVAESAVKLAPEMAEAHRVLALSRHINLQLEEAENEYKRTVELDPTSRASRMSLADLTRATGKPEDALAIYNDLLKTDPNDRAAAAGKVLSLFELGRKEEGTSALESALTAEPKNLALLSGVAYWLAAHGEYDKGFDYAKRAVEIEPRYTWAQIALVRSLLGLKKPVGAERAMRFAKQYGKFPTLTYELATVVATMGFFDEAAEILRESFTINEGQVATYLAGRISAQNKDFIDLLAPERRASIYQPTAADSRSNSKMLKELLALDSALAQTSVGEKTNEIAIAKTARDFGSGNDAMRAYRQLYAASRLVKKSVALPTALELVNEAKIALESALNVYVVTTAVQADELRDIRAQAIASGNIPDMEDAPRSALSNIMRGRMEDLTGWILFNQDKYPEAIEHLKKAATILPNGTPAWRNTLWHLGVAFEQTGKNNEALDNYIQSYTAGPRDSIHRAAIEKLYRKVNGSLYGLDDKIGPGAPSSAGASRSDSARPDALPDTSTSTTATPPQTITEKPAETVSSETTKPETTTARIPEVTPEPTPATTAPKSSSSTSESTVPSSPPPISEEALRSAGSRLRSNIKITGRIVDGNQNGLSNVVVVLISPSGSVLASTTDKDGNYSFTVTPSSKTYRVIPSKDGYTFSPVDKAFPGLIDDQKGIDFTGSTGRP